MKPTGFDRWAPPNIAWMLRVIIALDPSQKEYILKYKKRRRKTITDDMQ